MEIFPCSSSCYERLKRCWKRTKYQRLNGPRYGSSIKRKLKIIRLGGRLAPRPSRHYYSTATTTPKLKLSMLSPAKLLAKAHKAYAELMIKIDMSMDRSRSSGVSIVSTGEEVVDSRLAMEIYKKFSSSRLSAKY